MKQQQQQQHKQEKQQQQQLQRQQKQHPNYNIDTTTVITPILKRAATTTMTTSQTTRNVNVSLTGITQTSVAVAEVVIPEGTGTAVDAWASTDAGVLPRTVRDFARRRSPTGRDVESLRSFTKPNFARR